MYTLMHLNIETPKTINFLFKTNGKKMFLGVPILKLFWVTGILVQTGRIAQEIQDNTPPENRGFRKKSTRLADFKE